jgi:hypothetical protein
VGFLDACCYWCRRHPVQQPSFCGAAGAFNPQFAVRKENFALLSAVPNYIVVFAALVLLRPAIPAADKCKTDSIPARTRTSTSSSTAMREVSSSSTKGRNNWPFLAKYRGLQNIMENLTFPDYCAFYNPHEKD